MKLKVLLALLIFGSSLSVIGQSISPCQVGQNEAERIISKGLIYFPRLTVESSFTMRKMLEIEFGILDEVYDNGSDMQLGDEAECFFKIMKSEIDEKWGKDFLKKQRRIAKSLDKDGMGYVEPKENGIADSLSRYLKEEHPFDLTTMNYLVRLKLSPKNEVIDVAVLFGLPYATEISRELDDYLFIKEGVYKIDKVYEPGQLRGKPVESVLTFWIE